MSGIEVAGLVLGAIPIVVSAVEGYGQLLDGYKKARTSGVLVKRLARHLRDEQVAFEETCTTLLGENVPVDKIKSLLQDPTGRIWQDEDVQQAIGFRFDDRNEEVFRDTVQEINEAITELRSSLSLKPNGKAPEENGMLSKASKIKKIEFALGIARNMSQYEDIVRGIKDANERLRRLLRSNRDNENIRRYSSKRDVLDLLQGVASSVFRALRLNISCSCAHMHGFNFQLPVMQITTQLRVAEAIKKHGFRVDIVNDTITGLPQPAWSWNPVLLKWVPEVQQSVEVAEPSPYLPAQKTPGSRRKKLHKGVRFSDDPLDITSVVKTQWRSFRGSSVSSSTDSLQLTPTASVSSATTSASSNQSDLSMTTATSDLSSLSLSSTASTASSTTLVQDGSSATTSQHLPLSPPDSRKNSGLGTTGTAPSNPHDLCQRFAVDASDGDFRPGKTYGIVTDDTSQSPRNFEVICLKSASFPSLSSSSSSASSPSPVKTISLRNLLVNYRRIMRRPPLLPVKHKLASVVAASVLTLHGTPWMPQLLTSNDLLFIVRDGKPLLDRVFISKRLAVEKEEDADEADNSAKSDDNNGSNSDYGDDDTIDGIDTLLVLGVLLVEIGLWKPVWEFWDQEKHEIQNKEGFSSQLLPPPQLLRRIRDLLDPSSGPGYERTMSLLSRIECLVGKQYREAAQTCITGMLWSTPPASNTNSDESDQPSLDNPSFRDAVFGAVVAPLQQAARTACEGL